jgi:hypothetical protein
MSTVREPSGSESSNPGNNYGKTITYVPVAQAGAGTTQLLAASSGNRHKVIGVILTITLAGTLKFIDGSGDLTGAMTIATAGGFVIPGNPRVAFAQTAVNSALSIVTTVGAAAGVVLVVTEP